MISSVRIIILLMVMMDSVAKEVFGTTSVVKYLGPGKGLGTLIKYLYGVWLIKQLILQL